MITIKGKTPNAIWNEYQENEDNNAHTDNVVLLAQFFGSKADLKKAWGIYKQHEMSGHATKSIVDERNKLSAKLFPKLVKAKNQMKNGGGVDINELNMPVIRTQFEDEEYEFKDGGNVKVGDKVMLPEIKMRDGKIQFEKVENGEVLYIENGIYGVLNPKTKRIHQVSLNQIKFENGGTTKGFCYTIGGL